MVKALQGSNRSQKSARMMTTKTKSKTRGTSSILLEPRLQSLICYLLSRIVCSPYIFKPCALPSSLSSSYVFSSISYLCLLCLLHMPPLCILFMISYVSHLCSFMSLMCLCPPHISFVPMPPQVSYLSPLMPFTICFNYN